MFAAHLVEGKATFLPASPYLVRCFCQALSTQGRAPSTIRGYLTSFAGVHKAACFPDPTAHYVTRRLIKGLVLAHCSVDDRDPLSEQDLMSIIHALRHVGCSSYNMSLFRATFVLMFFGFLRISEVTKHRHNLQYNQCTVTSACAKLTFQSYKHSHVKPYALYACHELSLMSSQIVNSLSSAAQVRSWSVVSLCRRETCFPWVFRESPEISGYTRSPPRAYYTAQLPYWCGDACSC